MARTRKNSGMGSTALATTRTSKIVKGSLGQIAKETGKSLPEVFENVNVIAIVDTSGSMARCDSRDGMSRYNAACADLIALQNANPGSVAVFSFSDMAQLCISGTPVNQGGGTEIGIALSTTKYADIPGMRFVLISDGEPNDEQHALAVARTYKCSIDTVYVGPEYETGGREFLKRLAAASGGKSVQAYCVQNFLPTMTRLLEVKA